MVDKKLIISMVYFGCISRLPPEAKRLGYVFTELRKMRSKHNSLSDVGYHFNYKIANDAWVDTQCDFKENGLEFSNILMAKELIAREPWLVKYFKINLKSMDKLAARYNLRENIFRSKKITTAVLKNIDIQILMYKYKEVKNAV